MTTFSSHLLAMSEDESLTPDELRAWMRRAALRIQRLEAEARGHWVEMPDDDLDEDTETEGSA